MSWQARLAAQAGEQQRVSTDSLPPAPSLCLEVPKTTNRPPGGDGAVADEARDGVVKQLGLLRPAHLLAAQCGDQRVGGVHAALSGGGILLQGLDGATGRQGRRQAVRRGARVAQRQIGSVVVQRERGRHGRIEHGLVHVALAEKRVGRCPCMHLLRRHRLPLPSFATLQLPQ